MILFFVMAVRSASVGLDTWRYERYFYAICRNHNYAKRLGWEKLFVLLNFFAGRFNSFTLLLSLCALITVVGFGYFAYKNTEEGESAFWFVYFYITLNLYFNSMHLIRQICAMAICINIYTVLKKDRSLKGWIKAAVLLLIGQGFHVTAFFSLAFVIPFLLNKITKKTITNVIFLSVIGMAFLTVGQNFLLRSIERFSVYIGDERLSSGGIGVFAVAMTAIKIFMIAYTLTLNPAKPENTEIYRLTIIIVISTAFYLLQTQTQFALRLGYYYEVFMLLYIPAFIRKIRSVTSRRIAFGLMYLFGFTYFFYMMKYGGARSNRGTVPYTFFWQ